MGYCEFRKILIGKGRMILCRKQDLEKINVQKLIKTAFPELVHGFWDKFFKKIEYQVVNDGFKLCLSRFNCQVDQLEKNRDWDKHPFVAIQIEEKDGVAYCHARIVAF